MQLDFKHLQMVGNLCMPTMRRCMEKELTKETSTLVLVREARDMKAVEILDLRVVLLNQKKTLSVNQNWILSRKLVIKSQN